MALTYCFESTYVPQTLARCKRNDLAAVDTDGCETAVQAAVKRGVWVYGYLNIGALEKQRSYYNQFKSLRLARYEGWDGEYWIDVTDKQWQNHVLSLARQIKTTGAIGLYLDNTDIYYEILEKQIRKQYSRNLPSAKAVDAALTSMILDIHKLGLIVMPNGGDIFVKKFITEHPGVIATINQEGVFYEDFKKQSSSETAYRKDWCEWAQKHISGKVRIVEYCKKSAEIAKVKVYCLAHGWDYYISKHTNLEGD